MFYASRVKAQVSALDAARYYGIPVRGKSAKCIHDPTTTRNDAMHFYPDGKCYCYHCKKSMSCIDIVMELYGLDVMEACRKIDDDFHLGIWAKPDSAYREWADGTYTPYQVLQQQKAERAAQEEKEKQEITRIYTLYNRTYSRVKELESGAILSEDQRQDLNELRIELKEHEGYLVEKGVFSK